MKLALKQIFTLVAIIFIIIIVVGLIIPFVAIQLTNYEITDALLSNNNLVILFVIALHFIIGCIVIDKFKVLRNLKSKYIFGLFTIIYIGFSIIVSSVNGQNNKFYLLEISLLLGLGMGLLFRDFKRKSIRATLILIIAAFIIFTNYITIPFSDQYKLYHNFSGKSSKEFAHKIPYINNKGNNLFLEFKKPGKIYILDFWNNGCSTCYRKFSLVKGLQQKYKDRREIEVLAVNIYLKPQDITVSKKLLAQTGNADLITIYMDKRASQLFNISWYPTTIILKDDQIIFEGHIETLLLFENSYINL